MNTQIKIAAGSLNIPLTDEIIKEAEKAIGMRGAEAYAAAYWEGKVIGLLGAGRYASAMGHAIAQAVLAQ